MTQATTSDQNRIRGVLERLMAPIQQEVNRRAPPISQANAIQAQMRSQLPGEFDDVFRTARAAGGPEAMLNAAAKRPGLVPEVLPYDQDATRELLQRSVSKAVDAALSPSTQTGAQRPNAGLLARDALTEGLGGQALQANLRTLFSASPNPQAAVDGFNRVLSVAANASRPSGLGAGLEKPISGVSEAVRGGVGSGPQRVNVAGRIAQTVLAKNLRDNQLIKVLSRPDVMMRLEKIAAIPDIKLTPATIAGILPELFQERQDGP
jgi:hypothetical protein